jgi:rRNA-processing protein FCF1
MASNRIRGNSRRCIVFLDTSAIFMIFERNIRLEEELTRLLASYEIFILQSVINEISILKEQGSEKQKKLAKLAVQFIKRYPIFTESNYNNADQALLHEAMLQSAIVVTNDVALRKELHKNSLRSICLRGKNHLMLE